MKTRFLFLGLCCALAAISCTSIDDSASATKPLTITLTKDDSATKTTFAADGTGLTRVWKEGDAVSVLYIVKETDSPSEAEYYNEKFVLSAGAGTTKGTFTCASSHIPTTGTANVQILYPYTEDSSVYSFCLTRSLANQGNGSLDNLGNYDWMYAKGTFTEGVFSATSPLESQVSFLKIPQGTQLINVDATNINLTLSVASDYLSTSIHNSVIKYDWSAITPGSVTLTGIALSEKKTVSDIYIAISCMDGREDYAFTFDCYKGSEVLSSNTFTRNSSIDRAHVYTISFPIP